MITGMIPRHLSRSIRWHLQEFAAVALFGPRQVGKTTLARVLSAEAPYWTAQEYLDLENPADLDQLGDAVGYFHAKADRLVIIDEMHRCFIPFGAIRIYAQACLSGLLLAGVLLMAGCGGGGGSGGAAPDPPPPPAPPSPPRVQQLAEDFERHPEYRYNWGLRAVGAARAYARIAERDGVSVRPGTGVTVGLLERGVQADHWEFDPDRISELSSLGRSAVHGTAVASIIAAQRNNDPLPGHHEYSRVSPGHNFHGVAWGAELKTVAIPYDGWSEPGWGLAFARMFSEDIGLDILNLSFTLGHVRSIISMWSEAGLRREYPNIIPALAQPDTPDKDKVLLVLLAGNANGVGCQLGSPNCVPRPPNPRPALNNIGSFQAVSPAAAPSGFPVRIEELRSHMVAVVAVGRDGEVASFSNRCGIAAKWCIAVPGVQLPVAVPTYRDSLGRPLPWDGFEDGTSVAAPLVTGGLAVLKHYFRDRMGNTELLARLLETANVTPDEAPSGGQCPEHLDLDGDRSACELSSMIGRGLMDLDAATAPVGGVAVALGDTLFGSGTDARRVSAASSFLRSGSALGDALPRAFGGREIVVFDTLNAPFWLKLDGFAKAAARRDLERRLDRFMEPETEMHERGGYRVSAAGDWIDVPLAATRLSVGLSRIDEDRKWPDGHTALAGLADGGLSLTLGEGAWRTSFFASDSARFGGSERETASSPAMGARLAWRPSGSVLGLRFGALREFGSALGTMGGGAFGELASSVAFAGLDLGASFDCWRFEGSAEWGMASPETSSRGIVRGISTSVTSAFRLSMERALNDGSRLRLSLSQPLRVESGRLWLRIPVGRTRSGKVVHDVVDAPLAPSVRQLDLELDWRRRTLGGETRIGATVSSSPGHAAGRGAEFALLAGYRVSF